MYRKLLCGFATLLCAAQLPAQSVPARDLWEFPLGAVLEPAALAREPGGGLWNPAMAHVPSGQRWRVGVASIATNAEQSVEGQLLSASLRRHDGMTVGVSVARTAVASITRTETDPQAVGEVPYSSMLVSFTAAREILPHVTAGIAMRVREGRADRVIDRAIAGDLGIVVERLPVADARIAVSSFLWRPGRELEDRPAMLAALDVRLMGVPDRETRIGYTHNAVNRGAKEGGPFVSWRFDRVDLRAAYLQTTASSRTVSRIRTGLALHYARYVIGVAREEGATGLGPLYQFTLSSLLR